MNRKDTLRAALTARAQTPELPPGNSGEETMTRPDGASAGEGVPDRPRSLVRSTAVGAMGRSLGRLTQEAAEARALVAAGDKIVEIDPSLVDISFVRDRLDGSAEDHAAFVALIRERGQQVPILVRPHPERTGRYQVAYGHRRLRAAAELGRPVRAVIMPLNDEDLVVAQGQENSARMDLSYIERAQFAVALEERGFDRSVIMAALAMEKTQLSRLIAIGRSVPADVIAAIGPAPKAGRPRWAALADALARAKGPTIAERTCKAPEFPRLDSDGRFARLLAALTEPARGPRPAINPSTWSPPDGKAVVRIDRTAKRTQLTIDEASEPAFGAYLIDRLSEIYASFASAGTRKDPA